MLSGLHDVAVDFVLPDLDLAFSKDLPLAASVSVRIWPSAALVLTTAFDRGCVETPTD
jgi:hypothetical protein